MNCRECNHSKKDVMKEPCRPCFFTQKNRYINFEPKEGE